MPTSWVATASLQLVAPLLGLESASLSETEWLRRDNEALRHQNARLHQEIGQWKSKFHEWVRVEIARRAERERIGF